MSKDQPPHPDSPKAQLHLASSNPPRKYPFVLTIVSPFDPHRDRMNPSYIGKIEFEILRHEEALRIYEENMTIHLKKEGVTDYKIENDDRSVDFRFSSQKELNIARMYYLPEKPHVIDLSPENTDITMAEAVQKVFLFEQIFEDAGLAQKVHVTLNSRTKMIHATAADRRTLVEMMGNEYELPIPNPF